MHRYRLIARSVPGGETAYAVEVSEDKGTGVPLVSWRGAALERGWRDQIQTEARRHGWALPAPSWPDRRGQFGITVDASPADWPTILNEATAEHRHLAAVLDQHEQAWHRFIADVPKKEIQIKDIAAVTGFHRVWISELRKRYSSE